MAQNGFNRRSCNVTRTYPGTAARLTMPSSRGVVSGQSSPLATSSVATPTNIPSPTSSSSNRPAPGSAPTMLFRPLSRSQLAPVHVGGGGGGVVSSSSSSSVHVGSLLSPSSPLSALASSRPISLDQPRPTSERHGNVYLGAPVSHHNSSNNGASGGSSGVGGSVGPTGSAITHHGGSGSGKSVRLDSKITAAEQVRLPTNSRTKKGHSDTSSHIMSNVVTSQPTKRNLLEKNESTSSESGKVKLAESSITCPYCRKCRCEACATPRPLPSRWICSKSIHCGPEPLLDYVTCLCCVKAVFYHCGKNHEPDGGVLCADKPCSCAPHRKFWRWGCMAAMSVVLPCLCLYWPCRGCIGLAEKAYQKYHNNGCTCHRSSPPFASSDAPSSRAETTAGTDMSEDEDNHQHHSSLPSRYSHPPVVASRQAGTDKFLPFD